MDYRAREGAAVTVPTTITMTCYRIPDGCWRCDALGYDLEIHALGISKRDAFRQAAEEMLDELPRSAKPGFHRRKGAKGRQP